MTLNIEKAREYLQNFDFKTLFIEELGWSNSKNKNAFSFEIKGLKYLRKAIAELSGATIYEITTPDGIIPESKERDAVSKEIQRINFEHILIFIDKDKSQTIWRWVKKQDKKNLPREHYFSKGQTGDLFIGKIASLLVDVSEIENDITITDVAKKIQSALDVEKVTKKFFRDYQDQFVAFVDLIEGIEDEADRRWYASVILNRLMFIYFLQKKMFLDNGNGNYLSDKLLYSATSLGRNKFYNTFLEKLFFEGFAKAEAERDRETNNLIGKIKYLNGGLFLKHKIEIKYKGKISIADNAFENLFNLFNNYSWSLNDTPSGTDNEINPDVLGYIFEKYINQKAFGAYYTRTEITEYLCEQTVGKLILDAINEPETDEVILKKAGLDRFPKAKFYNTLPELFIRLDAATCKRLVVDSNAIIPNLSLLDPACGSGAFLVAAMKTLINVYVAVLGRIDVLNDAKLSTWKSETIAKHPNLNYYIKKQIITNNLYGVDIMEEATEIAKLRLFLALVASANNVNQLEPLPNIDFNIMSGNSLIGLMRVDENMFNTHYQPQTHAKNSGKVVQPANLFRSGLVQGNMFAETHTKSYQQLINEKEAAISSYKNAHDLGITNLQSLRDSIQDSEKQATHILNQLLEEEFTTLGIKYETISWDATKNKEGKSAKRKIIQQDIEQLEPFHWGYEFSHIFRKKNGFDAIIANPPWEIFKPTAKEFFKDHSKLLIQRKMEVEDFNAEKDELLKDEGIRKEWLDYLNKFPHQSGYYRKSKNFQHQTAIIDGKKAGSDINLYKLFLEQSFNLLRPNGRCGIIIPSGIYLDAGNKGLRTLIFDNTEIENLYGISNEKFLFEEVEHNIKYALLSFSKGGSTSEFNACFRINPRVAIGAKELDYFLNDPNKHLKISVSDIKLISPASFAIPEFKNNLELGLLLKIAKFPLLGENILKFSNEFHMTNDAKVFNKAKGENFAPLVEGKMIHQYQYLYAAPRYWIDNEAGRNQLLGRSKDTGQNLSYQRYRIAFRGIARATDSRTMIATLIPPNCFTSNSLAVVTTPVSLELQLFYLGIFNSMTFDFVLRTRISSNLNFFYIYNIPIPKSDKSKEIFKLIIEKVAQLVCTSEEFAPLWFEIMNYKWSEEIGAIDKDVRNKLKAEIDALVAHLYDLNQEEYIYVLSTFPVVAIGLKEACLNDFNNLTSFFDADSTIKTEVINLINDGENSLVEYKSTLRVDLKTNKPEKFIEHSVIKTLAAFLNSAGGTLIIGVEDNKKIIGLDIDFNSFSKHDKLDEFQKHFDNLISKTLGNRFHHYLKIDFPEIQDKTVCVITISQKSEEPVYVVNDAGQETFYIRRTASTIDLKPSEQIKYIKEHWN